MKFHKCHLLIIIFWVYGLFLGCKKLVDVSGPPTSINKDYVYNSSATAIAVLNGIYAKMSSCGLKDGTSINSFMSLYAGLSADEFSLFAPSLGQEYYINSLSGNTSPNAWTVMYPYLFTINSAIEGLEASTNLTDSVRNQLIGEAKFLRALHYFYLVNLYGDVPLILTTDYKVNSTMPRTDKDSVYKQMIIDLQDAKKLLSDDYLDLNVKKITNERVAPIKSAANALLARVYLFYGDFLEAEKEATLVISNTSLFSLSPLNDVFKMNSSEAIWQLQPVNVGWNTEDARVFVLPSAGPNDSWPVYLNDSLVASFEPGDQRRLYWIDSIIVDQAIYYYPNKYKSASLNAPITEYQMVLRLGEQFLIRAESRAQLGDLGGAIDDLNVIRNRAGLSDYQGLINKESIVKSILHERRIEFFSEWGNRWLDLKRTGSIDSVMTIAALKKGANWTGNAKLYPISNYELRYNNRLIQNPGY